MVTKTPPRGLAPKNQDKLARSGRGAGAFSPTMERAAAALESLNPPDVAQKSCEQGRRPKLAPPLRLQCPQKAIGLDLPFEIRSSNALLQDAKKPQRRGAP
jgi:hypothetical protein